MENDTNFRAMVCAQVWAHPSVGTVADFSNSELFWNSGQRDQFDLLFLDIMLPGMSGLDLLPLLHEYRLPAKTIVMSTLATEDVIVRAIQRGAIGYLWKSELRNIGEAIDIALGGGAAVSPTIALRMMQRFRTSEVQESPLTARETQILEILISGVNCDRCAELIGTTVNTVRKHVRNIYEKLQVKNRTELVRRAKDFGLTQ